MVRVSDFCTTCRLCAKAYSIEKLVKIFSSRGNSLNLKNSINMHLPIKVTEKDNLPLNICIMCLRRINATNEFFNTIISSDKLFNKILRKKQRKHSSLSDTHKDIEHDRSKKHTGSHEQKERNPFSMTVETSGSMKETNSGVIMKSANVDAEYQYIEYRKCNSNDNTDKIGRTIENNKLLSDIHGKLTKNAVDSSVKDGITKIDDLSVFAIESKINDNSLCIENENVHDTEHRSTPISDSQHIIQNENLDSSGNELTMVPKTSAVLISMKNNVATCNGHWQSLSNDILQNKDYRCNVISKNESVIVSTEDATTVVHNSVNNQIVYNDVGKQQPLICTDTKQNEYIVGNINILSNDNSSVMLKGSSNVVIGVANNVIAKNSAKIPLEVLRCPDCEESVKIFSLEERRQFFAYLKQHSCNKMNNQENSTSTCKSNQVFESFSEYKERYQTKKRKRKENQEVGDLGKSSSRSWPDGDLPADPGPDPAPQEDIFEDDVRLDDDFHWPMPKRNRRLHRCPSCDFITKSAVRLKSHQKLHRMDKRQNIYYTGCRHCYKQFETSVEARKHERLVHISNGAKNSLCEYCGLMKPQKTLRDHILKQHTVESEIEMQGCNVCGKMFISPTSLYLHKKTHSIERQHLCDLCGKAFKQRMAMRRHYMLHFPRTPPKFTCNVCDKRVTTRGSLRLHMMRHTGEKPQKCPECHMVMRHGLKHHMRLHSDDAPFKCVVCGADFKRRDYIRRHMRKHLNDTQSQQLYCSTCNYGFDDIKSFLIHHRDVHNNEIFTQIKTYECKNCTAQFIDSSRYRDHEEICRSLQENTRDKFYSDIEQTYIPNSYSKGVGDLEKSCGRIIIGSCNDSTCNCMDNTCVNYANRNCISSVCTSDNNVTDSCTIPISSCSSSASLDANLLNRNCTNLIYSGTNNVPNTRMYSPTKIVDHAKKSGPRVILNQKLTSNYDSRFYQNRIKSSQEFRRLKKIEESVLLNNEPTAMVLSEEVTHLDPASEYAYLNMDKQNIRDKNVLLEVEEDMIPNTTVHEYENHIEHFSSNTSSDQLQAQLCLPSSSSNNIYIHPTTNKTVIV
ncbi:uncharacterized protein LOC107263697 isoform X2 [Cephus cinctus]|uniref:Uncharacterized protein LOC107263697 isoform X2 n=1 Tax=Cephus cinctus TaxID=211228 RepID=A0AAJ7VXF9_CEPCN|nr:uncharacterized protein LOC107263697 isoform X2 [Cephus cinctus]